MSNLRSNGDARKLEGDGGEAEEEKSRTNNGGACQNGGEDGVVLGLDGGATSTVCVCMPFLPFGDRLPENLPILGRAVTGCTNHNSVGETAARDSLEQVISDALLEASLDKSAVRGVCLGVSGVNHPSDQERVSNWIRGIFPSRVKVYVQNDAVAALASGTMGKLHGCVLIAGTGCIAYGFDGDGREARASGAGPILGDWGSGYGIAAQALTAVVRAHDGRGPQTMLTSTILKALGLSSPDELIGHHFAWNNTQTKIRCSFFLDSVRWTYADPCWARIAALVPEVVSCAEAGDEIANRILVEAVEDLALSVKAVVQRLGLCGKDGTDSFPVVMVGGVLNANKEWDIGKEVATRIVQHFPGACTIRPKVEPAVGAAMLAMNLLTRDEEEEEDHNR
ncbi:PREDICTED: N-acetyl-D-glucosamine kinase isoform X2 [Tarenaya hassleriana]|uniref:N-acetyl-D-glucosamine kinase isoform X2 n=1 Tax=Tarenaya hassleriana TaxID=28532 RepID=UPI00053C4420|nr:PREDICTED: N-acetyl-D-glucosamine kinase isoform X2 [Tarenaya hassleriana]